MMSMDQHAENRAWAFQALDALQDFLGDEDFEGDREALQAALETKRRELHEGKYRVVFLGAFNVGKSTLINAFLEDEYLPTVLEECTTKITHVLRSDVMSLALRMSNMATEAELAELHELLTVSGIEAEVENREEDEELSIVFEGTHSMELLRVLNALITVYSDEDFPQFRSLREKFHEVIVYLPNNMLQEDIALVDSPGVHSISETHRRITEEIIPNSHLVVCLLDSQNAGTAHSRQFIESIIKYRHRKMFFVINKSDHLNENEIDPTGKRGPGKDLYRSLNGVVAHPELFFISSLYAMVASKLRKEQITLDALANDHKIQVPFSVYQEIMQQDHPEEALAEYLEQRSHFPAFKERLLKYLYTENREGAIVEFVSRFVAESAWKMYRPIETQLEMARHIPKLEDLRRQREAHEASIARNTKLSATLIERYQNIANGGEWDGVQYPDGRQRLATHLDPATLRQKLLDPLRAWLDADENLKTARKQGFKPLNEELEQSLDAYIAMIESELNEMLDEAEAPIRNAVEDALEEPGNLNVPPVEASHAHIIAVEAGLAKAYLGFAGLGALLGVAIGGGIGAGVATAAQSGAFQAPLESALLQLESMLGGDFPPTTWNLTLFGGAVGAPFGVVLGLIVRSLRSDDLRRYLLNQRIGEKIEDVLRKDLHEKWRRDIDQRQESFIKAVQAAFDRTNEVLSRQINAIKAEEEALIRAREALVNRLEPKLERLKTTETKAREICEGSIKSAAE